MTYLEYANWVPLPAPVTSGSGVQSFTAPDGEVWVAKNGVNSGNWFKARDVLHARYYRSAAYSFPTTQTIMLFDTVVRDPYGLYNAGTGYVTLPVAGSWFFHCVTGGSATAASQFIQHIWTLNDTNQFESTTVYSPGAVGFSVNTAASRFFNSGDRLSLVTRASVAMVMSTSNENNCISADYLGSG